MLAWGGAGKVVIDAHRIVWETRLGTQEADWGAISLAIGHGYDYSKIELTDASGKVCFSIAESMVSEFDLLSRLTHGMLLRPGRG